MGRLLPAALLLLAVLPLMGFTTDVAGGGSTCLTMRPGGVCYKDFSASAVGYVNVQSCDAVKVSAISNIASGSDHDASVVAYACPAGTTTASATLCRIVYYRDSTGNAQSALTGEAAVGRDAIYGVVAQNLVVDVTTTGQTTRVQVDCR